MFLGLYSSLFFNEPAVDNCVLSSAAIVMVIANDSECATLYGMAKVPFTFREGATRFQRKKTGLPAGNSKDADANGDV